MKEIVTQARNAWMNAWSNTHFRWQLIITLLLLAIVSKHNFYYLNIWEFRTGERLNDPLLNMLPPVNFSNFIFFFTYSTITLTILSALPYPGHFVRGLQAFSLITFLRTSAIYFFPLQPPADMVLLVDPVAEFLLHNETIVTKDLFFSGHTATLALMFLFAQNKYLKIFCFVALIIAPAMLIWQHVHYTIDIIVAPFVSYGCVKLVDWLNNNYDYGKVLFRY